MINFIIAAILATGVTGTNAEPITPEVCETSTVEETCSIGTALSIEDNVVTESWTNDNGETITVRKDYNNALVTVITEIPSDNPMIGGAISMSVRKMTDEELAEYWD